MSTLAEPETALPFFTRFPRAPRLALPRRRRADTLDSYGLASAVTERPDRDADRLTRQIELALALRERAVADTEARLADRLRDLDEMEALLHAREALLAATRLRNSGKRGVVTLREAGALHQLKVELDRQESSLRETRQALLEREQFMEQSETQLFAKVQQQQEKETELEQREENLLAREARLHAATFGPAAETPVAKPAPDEFRE